MFRCTEAYYSPQRVGLRVSALLWLCQISLIMMSLHLIEKKYLDPVPIVLKKASTCQAESALSRYGESLYY